MKLSSFLVLAAFGVVSTFATTLTQVRTNIADIVAQVNDLDKSIANYHGGFIQAMTINRDAVRLVSTLNKGADDAKAISPSPVSGVDGNEIFSQLEALEPTIGHALDGIVEKKPLLDALPLGNIKKNLRDLSASTTGLAAALTAVAPADLVPDCKTLEGKINASFAKAIAAYA